MSSEKELILIFSIGEYKFSVAIKDLIEIRENLDLTLEGHSEECLGKFEFRGSEIPLVNIKKRLSLTADMIGAGNTAAVVRVWDKVIAIPIDSVEGVFEAESGVFIFPQLMLREKDVFTLIYDWKGEYVFFMNLPGIYSKETINEITKDG